MGETLEIIETSPDISVRQEEYIRLLGLPDGFQLSDELEHRAATARAWYQKHGRPWIYARIQPIDSISGDVVTCGDTILRSKHLSQRLASAGAMHVFLVAVSAGAECEAHAAELWTEERPDDYFFLETFGSAVVEHLIAQAAHSLCAWADGQGLWVLPHLSPGYTGWNIQDQHTLHGALTSGARSDLPARIELLDSGMLRPKKSLLAVFGVTATPPKGELHPGSVPCVSCSLKECSYRRLPYSAPPLQKEGTNVPRLTAVPPPRPEHRYSLSPRVLRKWAAERLDLRKHPDGSVDATFRYSGTTCMNIGTPLEFLYTVSLASSPEGFTIKTASCAPAPDDHGYKEMCEYRDSGGAVMRDIAKERPLLGRPLHDIFRWERTYSPSGCYCNQTSRDHKWGVAYEVIAYALLGTSDGSHRAPESE